MKIERTKNAIRNTKWGFAQRLVNILFPFLVRTVLIYTLGAGSAGLSSLFTSILSILSLTELGFSNAVVYSMYKPVAEDDRDKICSLLNVYRKAYLVIGSVILGIGLILIPLLPHLISGDVPANTNLYLLYIIYLVNNVISYFLYGYKTALLSAYQREDVISRNMMFYSIVLYSLQCGVLIAFKNYYAYAIVIPLSTILLNLLNNRAVTEMFPDYKPAGTIDDKEKADLKKNIIGIMIWKVGGATRNTFDSIVVSMYLGLVTVAMYNNYFYIISGVNSFLGVICTSITAGVGNKMAVETTEQNYKDFKSFQFYYMWLSGWCAICMLCLYQPFMRIWMGENLMFSNHIMILFCYYFIMMKQGDINSVYYQAAGLWWYGKYRSVIEAIINLTLNFVLGKYFGVVGILLATIIAWTAVYFYGSRFIFTEYFKNGKLAIYYYDNFKYLSVSLLVGYITFSLCKITTSGIDNKYLVLLVTAFLACGVSPVLLSLAYLAFKKDRILMQNAMKRIRHFFSKNVHG